MITKRTPNFSCLVIIAFSVLAHGFFNAQPADSVKTNVFDFIRPPFEVMEFIAASDFVKDYKTAGNRLAEELKKHNIFPEVPADLQSANKDLVFKSKDGAISIILFQSDDGDYLHDKWKSTLKGMGYKSDIRNDDGGSVFLKTKIKSNSAVGALCYTGRNMFEIVLDLPFPVETFDDLDAASVLIIKEKYKTLYEILESIARTYVLPEAFIMFPSRDGLTRDQRLYGLIQFWTEVKYNFAFFDQVPNLNWDHALATYIPIIEKDQSTEEYYNNLSRLCALLKDGHTNIYKPNAIDALIVSPPVQLTNIQNKAIVSNVSQSLAAKLPIGSEIISVEGVQTQQYLHEQIFPYISSSTEHILYDNGIRTLLNGKKGTKVNIEYKTPDGKVATLVLDRSAAKQITWATPLTQYKMFEFKRLPQNVAYVALNTFGNSKIVEEFENHIDSINSCERLIIDIRSNGGGSSTNAYRIIEHLTDKPFLTSKWRTREHRSAHKAWGSFRIEDHRNASRKNTETLTDWDNIVIDYYKGDHWYGEAPETVVPPDNKKIRLPIVVLTGHKTASAAEDFLIALENTKRARTVGSKTFGSTGQPLLFKLPGGGSARVCTKRDEYPDGRQFIGYGIKPDVEIESTVEDLIKGSDAVLAKGLQVLNSLKK
jgi:C-terminal processing protease CtpA/Prc